VLPDGDALDVLKQVEPHHPRIKSILFVSVGPLQFADPAKLANFHVVLTKPVMIEALVEALEEGRQMKPPA
jgi:DNA-binding NtrC family response regulator